MPWNPKDAAAHDKKAKTPKSQRQWADVANNVLKTTGDEGRAVREANGVVMRREIGQFKGKASETRSTNGKRKTVTRHA